jgi:hypothetical protein
MIYEEGTKFTIGNSSPTRHNKKALLNAVVLDIVTDELMLMTGRLRISPEQPQGAADSGC